HFFPQGSFWRLLSNSARDAKIHALWRVLDPIGDARLLLRSSVERAAKLLRDRLRALRESRNDSALARSLASEVRGRTLDREVAGRNAQRCALAALDGMTPAEQRDFAELWAQRLDQAERWHGAAESVIAATQRAPRDVRITKIQECSLFTFENVKLVDVD